ncbi:helix-turn-helix transcriptional regulator [Lysinibacter cavernae]|uniref:helix-turn-helix transcriptional regulator n=1 Tax=Lysinibacter cavernae TaxID=1640652 RepID=UPI0036186B29
MIGRDSSVAMALSVVKSGASIDVVGSRGSGRSSFLALLKTRLEVEEWQVVSVRGVASLRQHPLAAMQIAGIGEGLDLRTGMTIPATVEALRDKTRTPRSVLFVDDWDDVDESSWGVAEAVRRATGLPIVVSRLQGLRARHTPSGLAASSLEPSFVVDMSPLRFEEMEQVIITHLGSPVDGSTMSRIFTKSGGIVGLALNLVDAAVRERRLQLVDGMWSAVRDMWSPALRGVVEGHLENLGSDARDALEIIALVGVADVDTVRKLVPWDTLEILEERAMIRFLPTGSRQLASVAPPLLVEFFRHEPMAARRIRLTELIIDKLGSRESLHAVLENFSSLPVVAREDDALFVRLLQERARTRRIVCRAEWVRTPTPDTAVTYVNALLNAAGFDDVIVETLNRTDLDIGDNLHGSDDLNRVRFAILRAQWLAYIGGDLLGAIQQLIEETRSLGTYARMADAAAVVMEANLGTIPEDFATRLELDDTLPEIVTLALCEAQITVLITLGRFQDAHRVFNEIQVSITSTASFTPSILYGLVLLGLGNYDKALSWSLRGLDESSGQLDITATRAHSAVAVFCYVISGNYTAAQSLLDTVLALGDPPPFPLSAHLTLLNLASIVAIRQGNVALGEKYAADLNRLPEQDGPFPGQVRAWSEAQLTAFYGHPRKASDLVWNAGDRLWNRGAHLSAVLMYTIALEITPNPVRLEMAMTRAASIDGTFVQPHLDFIAARDARDPQHLVGNTKALIASGRPGLAVLSYQLAADYWRETGQPDLAAGADTARNDLIKKFGTSSIDTTRFTATAINLTDREREIAMFISDGLTNPEIATRLVLSVRTVESHLRRILRKTELSDRQELVHYIQSLNP